jgi:hypothetical protein
MFSKSLLFSRNINGLKQLANFRIHNDRNLFTISNQKSFFSTTTTNNNNNESNQNQTTENTALSSLNPPLILNEKQKRMLENVVTRDPPIVSWKTSFFTENKQLTRIIRPIIPAPRCNFSFILFILFFYFTFFIYFSNEYRWNDS